MIWSEYVYPFGLLGYSKRRFTLHDKCCLLSRDRRICDNCLFMPVKKHSKTNEVKLKHFLNHQLTVFW